MSTQLSSRFKAIIVLYGGESELDASLETVQSLQRSEALEQLGTVEYADIRSESDLIQFFEMTPHAWCFSNIVVFIATYGKFADRTIVDYLEEKNVVFTGPDKFSSCLAYNKTAFKQFCAASDIKMPNYLVLDKNEVTQMSTLPSLRWIEAYNTPVKVVVKPNQQGDSVGLRIVTITSRDDYASLKTACERAISLDTYLRQPSVIVEEFIEGVEYKMGMLAGMVLQDVYSISHNSDHFDLRNEIAYEFLPPDSADRALVINCAQEVFEKVGCFDYGRVDLVSSAKGIYVIGFNARPGLRSKHYGGTVNDSVFVHQYGSGSYVKLIHTIVRVAVAKETQFKLIRQQQFTATAGKTLLAILNEYASLGKSIDVFRWSDQEFNCLCQHVVGRCRPLTEELLPLGVVGFYRQLEELLSADSAPNLSDRAALVSSIWQKVWRWYQDQKVDQSVAKVCDAIVDSETSVQEALSPHSTDSSFHLIAPPIAVARVLLGLTKADSTILQTFLRANGGVLNTDMLRNSMLWNDKLVVLLQKTFQFWESVGGHDYARRFAQRVIAICDRAPRRAAVSFEGAGVPIATKRTQKYCACLHDFLALLPDPYGAFGMFYSLMEELSTEIFGPEFLAYPTNGTYRSFQNAIGLFKDCKSFHFVVTNAGEYTPMVELLLSEFPHNVKILRDAPGGLNFRLEDIESNLMAYMSRRSQRAQRPTTFVVVISSCIRLGGRYLDLQPLADRLHEQTAFKVLLLVDASQDDRVITYGDITWYSKRFAGTGAGMVFVRNPTGMRDLLDSNYTEQRIKRTFEVHAGYDQVYLERICCTLVAKLSKVTFSFHDMLEREELWDAEFMQHYALDIVRRARRRIGEHGKYFYLHLKEEEVRSIGDSVILPVRFTDAFHEHYRVVDLLEVLKHEFVCSSFSLAAQSGLDVQRLRRMPPSTFNQFLTNHRDFVVWYPSVFRTQDVERALKQTAEGAALAAELQEAMNTTIQLHEVIRIFVDSDTGLHSVDRLVDSIKRFISSTPPETPPSKGLSLNHYHSGGKRTADYSPAGSSKKAHNHGTP